MSKSIVVFTASLGFALRKGIVEIDCLDPDLHWLVILESRKKSLAQLLRSQRRNLRRNGWRWIPYQLGNALQRLRRDKPTSVIGNLPGTEYAPSALGSRRNVRILAAADMHADAIIDVVRGFEPDLGISWAAPILRRSLFSIPRLGTLNLHQGKLPDYRGMPPAFWELWNDEKSVGCTVHWVDDKLDTGAIAAETSVTREPYSTVRGVQLRLDEAGIELMRETVRLALDGASDAMPQPVDGTTYRKPTLRQVAALKTKLRRRSVRRSPRTRQWTKDTIATGAFHLWRMGMYRILPPRITVLLYHRVSDDARDDLTVGIEQFDAQMAMLREYCTPISVEQALATSSLARTARPLVSVTFDDGYLDNYLNAAPILLRHQIPAAFFVATGLMGTDRRFPHDELRGNPPIPNMDWEHLRRLREWGFLVGSHTVNHVDCGGEPEAIVEAELEQSLQDLRRELGLDQVLFAYPYGGRDQMPRDRLSIAKSVGYSACLSAYGGTNLGAIDPFDVRRRGIHWEFSGPSFLLECLGLR